MAGGTARIGWLSGLLLGCDPRSVEVPVTPTMPEVCALGEPSPLEDGLPPGSWSGLMLIEGDDHLTEIGMTTKPFTVWTDGLGGGFSWIALDEFDFDVDPVAWHSAGDPRGTCEPGLGVLDCTVDDEESGHRGTRKYQFSPTCTWIEEQLFVGEITQRSHTEVALVP